MSRIVKDKGTIINEVKIILDQNESDSELIAENDIDQLTTDELIEHLLYNALERVYSIAPLGLLADVAKVYKNPEWDSESDKYAQITDAPDDYLRLIYVKLKGWDKGVTSFIDEEDPLYFEYRSPYVGIRPTIDDPGVAVVYSDEGEGMKIQCYPKTGEGGVIRYISSSDAFDGDEITIAGLVYQGFLYTVANLYYVSLGQENLAKMMAAEAEQALRLNTDN